MSTTASNDPYVQDLGLEAKRVCLMLGLYTLTGVLVGLSAAVGPSVIDGRLRLSSLGVMGSVFFGAFWCSLAVVPMWHRPLWTGWAKVAIPSFLLATLAGAALGHIAGGLVGISSLPLIAMVVRRRLPFVYPRHPPGLCPSCGYPTTKLISVRCPECGATSWRRHTPITYRRQNAAMRRRKIIARRMKDRDVTWKQPR